MEGKQKERREEKKEIIFPAQKQLTEMNFTKGTERQDSVRSKYFQIKVITFVEWLQ